MTAVAVPARERAARRRIRWNIWVPAAVWILLILVAAIGPLLAPYDATKQIFADGQLRPPGSPGHLLGTDLLARDELSRLIVGTRMSLIVSACSVVVGGAVGIALGVLAGYLRGWFDAAVMRMLDSLLAFPTLVLALIIAVGLGPGVNSAIIAIGVVNIPGFARFARAQTLRVAETEFVAAARVMGAGRLRMIRTHVLRNIWVPCAAQAALAVGKAIPAEASLSFLGLGVQLPTPSWGNMIGDAYKTLAADGWLVLWPVLMIMAAALSASFLADALGDRDHWQGGRS